MQEDNNEEADQEGEDEEEGNLLQRSGSASNLVQRSSVKISGGIKKA